MRLTDLAIKQLACDGDKPQRIRDEALPGFGIVVGKKSKTFFVMYGTARRLKTLGRWPDTSLKEARTAAKRFLAHPPPKTRYMRLSELQEAFLERCERTLRANTVRRYRAAFQKRQEEATSPHEIAAYKAMFNWGLREGYVGENPFQHKQAIFAKRDRVLTDDEIRSLWQHDRPPFSDILNLLILTGQRRGQFERFDHSWVQDDCINFPTTVMKSKRPHTIPLTDWTRPLVQQLIPFNGWGKSKARLDKESGVSNWVLHDTRRYFSSTMAKLGVPLHITEHLMDHRSSTSGVQAVYMRYGFLPEMKAALATYEQHLHTVTA